MGRFSAIGMCYAEPETIDRPHSPGMDEIGEILLPQYLVDEILKDVKVDVPIGGTGVVYDKIVYELRDTTLVDMVGGDAEICLGDIQVHVSGFDTGRIVNDGSDHLDHVGKKENIDISSFDMNGTLPGGIRTKKSRCISSQAALRKEKRKIANRVAAAKSHASKRAQLEMLESKLESLKKENLRTRKSLQFVKGIPEETTIRFQLRRTSSL